MKEKMFLLQKRRGTGMHQTHLSAGSIVNGETYEKRTRAILRPGDNVTCIPEELGVHGLSQFEFMGPAPDFNVDEKIDQTSLRMVKRKNGAFWDIINPKNPDKPLNTKALRKKEAEALLAEMLQTPVAEPDEYDDMDWNQLVSALIDLDLDLEDEWENEDDLRKACRDEVAKREVE